MSPRGPAIAIVDDPATPHGALMSRCARAGGAGLAVRWLAPTLDLPDDLSAVTDVDAVAIPLGVRGATLDDRFTQRLMAAVRVLRERGIPVLVAAGIHRPNLLARAGVAVSTGDVPGSGSTSEACVRAAAQIALGRAPVATRPETSEA